ncbi:MAG: UDP-N-acetylmuramate dehydrogenase [Candidatus Saccharimonadales bacterium]
MKIENNQPLSGHSTMRLGGPAKFLMNITSREQITEAVEWAKKNNCKIIMIGHGSNIVWQDSGFDGLVLVNKIPGFNVNQQGDEYIVKLGAGEVWDEVVNKLVVQGLSGVEQLSLIPGTVGATPVQNVGAYGRELSEVLISVEAFDLSENKFVEIANEDCGFSYRKSRFNQQDSDRFLICAITLKLHKANPAPPFYATLEKYLSEHRITEYTPLNIRSAVIEIRNSKLPDPAKVANCGSFFGNPIVNKTKLLELKTGYPEIQSWDMKNSTYKVSAAWLLDQLGLKGYKDPSTGMALWHAQPLVFVNENAKSTKDLLSFREKIKSKVQEKFGIDLKQEPELI